MKKSKSRKNPQKKKKLGKPVIIFLSIFILPGLCLGLFTTFKTILVQNWVEVEATIDSTYYQYESRKKRRSNRKGGYRSSKTYTVSQVRAKYTYLWKGKTYQSDQVALWQGFTKDKERNEALEKFLDEAKIVKAFVNPNAPEEALLTRCIHNGILLGYVSAFACFVVIGTFSGLIMKFPSFKFGVICLVLTILLYGWFFGMGGVYLINYIEILEFK